MQTSVDNSCGFATLLCLGIGQQLQLSTAAERCWWKARRALPFGQVPMNLSLLEVEEVKRSNSAA